MTEKESECSSYVESRDVSTHTPFWTKDQEEMHDHVYKKRKVFEHKYVNWSDSTDLVKNVATKYESLGVKNLVSQNIKTWVWNEDVIRKFYSTLTVSSDRTEISFMVGTTCHVVAKEKFEEALGIKSMTGSILLHDLNKQRNEPASSKRVCNLLPEVDLIQKINRCTLLPVEGYRNGCSDVSIRLANAIWKGENFDVASFIFTEMQRAANNKRPLPYGPYICSVLRGLDYITDESMGETCSPTMYTPEAMKESVTLKSLEASNIGLTKRVEYLEASNVGLKKQVESVEATNIGLRNQVESLEANNIGLAKQLKSLAAAVDKLTKQLKGSEEKVEGLEFVRKPLGNVVVQSEMPLEKCYKRTGGSGA